MAPCHAHGCSDGPDLAAAMAPGPGAAGRREPRCRDAGRRCIVSSAACCSVSLRGGGVARLLEAHADGVSSPDRAATVVGYALDPTSDLNQPRMVRYGDAS